jgi:carbon storage regulator
MLILTRKVGENVVVDGRIHIKVLRLDGDGVKLGIEAPAEVSIHRQEVYDEIQRTNQQAVVSDRPRVPKLDAAISGTSVLS